MSNKFEQAIKTATSPADLAQFIMQTRAAITALESGAKPQNTDAFPQSAANLRAASAPQKSARERIAEIVLAAILSDGSVYDSNLKAAADRILNEVVRGMVMEAFVEGGFDRCSGTRGAERYADCVIRKEMRK